MEVIKIPVTYLLPSKLLLLTIQSLRDPLKVALLHTICVINSMRLTISQMILNNGNFRNSNMHLNHLLKKNFPKLVGQVEYLIQ
jgi:hypothetical protein